MAYPFGVVNGKSSLRHTAQHRLKASPLNGWPDLGVGMPIAANQCGNAHGRFETRRTENIDIVVRADNRVICDPLNLGTLLADLIDRMVFESLQRLGLV